ncbi:SAYSvFN domain-containing protein 1 [Papilio machaon]|uniref:SAYSvFN domain-containing protein 1 n=1 Tax=Papilio machaon TaxID=76193 RepID=UPI001E665261|nr:SAYSvFN domain-containing protein 1 [Papilio machaon]
MEAKLKEYRALRHRKWLEENEKAKAKEEPEKSFLNFLLSKNSIKMDDEKKEDEVPLVENEEKPTTSRVFIQPDESPSGGRTLEPINNSTEESWKYCITKWSIYFIIWLTVYIIFLKLQFGAVYFVVSLLIGIYLNTRTGPKKEGEVSAYSVFNENCASIDGTLSADQIVRELTFGPGNLQ